MSRLGYYKRSANEIALKGARTNCTSIMVPVCSSKTATSVSTSFSGSLSPAASIVIEKKTLVLAGHLPSKIWEVNLAIEGISAKLILWSEEHRRRVLLQVILCTTLVFDAEGKCYYQIDRTLQKIHSRRRIFTRVGRMKVRIQAQVIGRIE